MRELEPVAFDDLLSQEIPGQHETMTEWLVEDPALRYQFRGAMSTFNIDRATGPDYLGYTTKPFIDMNKLRGYFDLPIGRESPEERTLAHAMLAGYRELREDIKANLGKPDAESVSLETFSQLPSLLQYIGAFKAIERFAPVSSLTDKDRRSGLKDYFVGHLGVPEHRTEDILQSAAIVDAQDVMDRLFSSPDSTDIETTGVSLEVLMGPKNPDYGIHFGIDLEEVVSKQIGRLMDNVYTDGLYYATAKNPPSHLVGSSLMDDYKKDYRKFGKKVSTYLESVAQQCNLIESEMPMWKSYFFTKAAFADVFAPTRHEGFDGGLDQFVAWRSPRPDAEYRTLMLGANGWVGIIQSYGYEIDGINLARRSFALDLIDRLEDEVAYNSDKKRGGRLESVAEIVSSINEDDPGLADSVLNHATILRPAIQRAMHPWSYRFMHQG